MARSLTELIARAPWREAVIYRHTWPHEYVLSEQDGQQDLLAKVCERLRAGRGLLATSSAGRTPIYLSEITSTG